ncbi:MAG TPA: NUDIX hydrolase [Candidatus Methylomirabilis sp.]|nr:NUDIX hydrolase [Candidatus Methylomirabilis sp.]
MVLNGVVRAAGGVVWRRNQRGEVDVLLVHRDGQRDWSFPKGKREAGETDEMCALREVQEETGLRCALGLELPSTAYHDRKGRAKVVRYWAMSVVRGKAEARHEVDAVRWLGIPAAANLLTYPRDRELLAAFNDRFSQPARLVGSQASAARSG